MDVTTRRSLEVMFPGGHIDERTERLANEVSDRLELTGSKTIRKDVLAFIAVVASRNGTNGSATLTSGLVMPVAKSTDNDWKTDAPLTSTAPANPEAVVTVKVDPGNVSDTPGPENTSDTPGDISDMDWDSMDEGFELLHADSSQVVKYVSRWGVDRIKVSSDPGKNFVASKSSLSFIVENVPEQPEEVPT